uniref:RNA helicase n=1 Tax=Amphilophus citrinellus TaxID=61819 RepID=A0A3Q0RW22_AMPCI
MVAFILHFIVNQRGHITELVTQKFLPPFYLFNVYQQAGFKNQLSDAKKKEGSSPGTGGAKTLDKAVEHVLQICANLDSAIVSTKKYAPELKERVPRPKRFFDIVEQRAKDPFGDHLKWMMNLIHDYMDLPPDFRLRECGTQEYEADVVILEQRGVQENNRLLAQCALHLRQYNDALLINDTLRMVDAYRSLKEFYITKRTMTIDGTDFFLLGLFEGENPQIFITCPDMLTPCFRDFTKDSRYSVVAQAGGREVRREHMNEYLEDLTGKAIDSVQSLSHREFRAKITELQEKAFFCSKLEQRHQADRRSRNTAASIQLLCRNCFTPVASGSDIKLVDNVQYVNINPDFKRHYKVGEQVILDRSFEDWEPGCRLRCKICNKEWGFEIKYKKSALMPNLAIKNFALETPDGRRTVKKWKDVPFTVEDFSIEEYIEENFPDLFN